MKLIYSDAIKTLPPTSQEALGEQMTNQCFCGCRLAGKVRTCKSQTDIIMYGNMNPLIWYRKRQATVESSFFGSEFAALRILVDMLWGLHL